MKRSPQGSIYAYRWWLDAVAPGMYEILKIEKGDEIQAAWPVVYRKIEGAKHVHMPALTQKLGILFAPSNAKPAETQSSNQKLSVELMKQLGAPVTFHHNFHENFTDWLPFYWQGYSQTTRYTYVLEDLSDMEALWTNMRANARNKIRKAQKLRIDVRDDLELECFLDLNRKTFARQGMNPLASDELARRLDAACTANAGRKIFAGVDSLGRVHAAVYVVWADDTAYYVMGGSAPDLRESGAHMLALWQALLFARSVVKRFDFEGSMLPHVEPVFRGFGATPLPYSSITRFPPAPTSLRGLLGAAVKFRWDRLRNKARHNEA